MPPLTSRRSNLPPQSVFLQSTWSPWPAADDLGYPNIVSGARRISHEILSICLIRKGEIHPPDFGIAMDLFIPMNSFPVDYWTHHLTEEIAKWVSDASSIKVDVTIDETYMTSLLTEISFVPVNASQRYSLEFPLFSSNSIGLLDALATGKTKEFLNSVYLK
ncbi:MAG: hypothetical protein WBB28_20800 [Crinalium sp.]